jgi:fucose 4-O-acetylase-like acetyltransferase
MGKRIEFLDLAKGICMIFLVFGHSGFIIDIPGLTSGVIPLFFVLSGFFFKTYGGWLNCLIKKTNTIFIPFLFFYLVGCLAYYGIKYLAPNLLITAAGGIMDIFNNRQFFNGPIWYILCIFWCSMYFCTINLYLKSKVKQSIIVVLLGFIGWWMGNQGYFLPLFLDVAMTALPFFAIGYYLKQTDLFYPNKWDKYNWLWALIAWAISYALLRTTHTRLSLHYNIVEGFSTYLLSISSVIAILYLCKMVKNIPLISYMGRYSLVLMCTHHLIYRPLMVAFTAMGIQDPYFHPIVAIVTLALSTLCIPLCIRYIPWFVAQKDLIKYEGTKA